MSRWLLLAMILASLAHAGKAAKLNEAFVLKLHETASLPGGLKVTFASVSVEEIAPSPQDPKSYPAGSGVNVTLELSEGKAAVERLTLSELSAGYESTPAVTWKRHQVFLINTEDPTREPKITLRIETLVREAELAGLRQVARRRNAQLAFVYRILSITPTFPIDDMPSGYGVWKLRAQVIQTAVGELVEARDTVVETDVELFFGPVRGRPVGLWVNEQPPANSVWLALCTEAHGSAKSLLSAKGAGVVLTVPVEKLPALLR